MKPTDIIDPVADPRVNRSPCFKCPMHESGLTKNCQTCEHCEHRIQFIKDHCGPTTIEEIVELNDTGPPITPRDARMETIIKKCKNCQGVHYARGLCKNCYYKERWAEHKTKRIPKGTRITIFFSRIEGGVEMLNIIKSIAEQENRNVSQQVAAFLAKATLDWLEGNR